MDSNVADFLEHHIEIANDMMHGELDFEALTNKYGDEVKHMTSLADHLSHFVMAAQEKVSEGNTTAVLVALPSKLDPVRLVGDEEKHATLMYFGETDTLPDDAKSTLIKVAALAASTFSPFREGVMDICRLGSDDPPALVLKLSGRQLPEIRKVLQIVPEVNDYLGNADQYPNYTPHVTLAYPDFKGEAELRKTAAALPNIWFDRLALWWNDERFEFSLNPNVGVETSSEADLAYHADLEGFLEHFGVKGMKWGIRRARDSGGIRTAQIDKTTKGYTINMGQSSKLKDSDFNNAAEKLRAASMSDATKSGKSVMGITDFHENEDGTISATRIAREIAHTTAEADYALYSAALNDKYDKVVLNHEGYFK